MATEIAALGLKVDSRGLVSAISDLERLSGAADKAERSAGRLSGGAEKASRATRAQGDAARRAANDNRALAGQINFADTAMMKMARTAMKLGAGLGLALGVRSVLQTADAWKQMENRVGVAVRSMEDAPRVMERMVEISRASFSSLNQTVTGFERAAVTFRDMGRSAEDAARYVESLNLMLVAGYVEGERAASVQQALAKAMAIGRLDAQGLETVMANSSEVAGALADELGVTVSSLRQMASQGKITGDVIANAMTKSLEEMREIVAQMPWTMRGAMTAISLEWEVMTGRANAFTGVTALLAKGIITLAQNLERVASVAVAAAIVFGGRLVASLALTAANIVRVSGALALLRGAIVRTGVGALIVGLGELIYWFGRVVEATGSVGKAFTALGELAGLTWKGIIDSAKAIGPGLESVWHFVRKSFYDFIADLILAWSSFLELIHGGLKAANVEGVFDSALDGVQGAINSASDAISGVWKKSSEAAAEMEAAYSKAGDTIADAFEPARKKLSEILAITKDTSLSTKAGAPPGPPLGDALGSGQGSVDKAAREAERLARAYDNMIARGEEFVARQRMEQQTIGLTAEAANRLRHEFDFLADAQRQGIELTPQQTARLSELAGQMAATEERTSRLREAFDFTKETVGGFFEDFRRGLQDGENIWRAFANAATSAIDKVVDRLMNQLLDAIFEVNSAASGGGGGFLGQVLGMVGGLFGTASMGSGAGHNVGSGIGPGTGGVYAKGGVVSGAGISAYSGSIVSQPTLFPFAKGVGLMGEAGPEAILPLRRGPGGRLGVETSGGGGVHVEEHIHNYGGSEVTTNTRDMGDGKIIREIIIGTVNQDIAQRGPISRSLQGAYGLKRGGVG